jgi:uncharacterized damage-inducible protein DinB
MKAAALILSAGCLLVAPVQAQKANDPAAATRKAFNEVAAWVVASAERVPADKYDYKPVQTVRTFGQLIGHVADGMNYYCANGAGKTTQWSDPVEKTVSGKTALVEKLKSSVAACNSVYAAAGQWQPLIDNVGHTNLHYGNIITYLRMLGLVPPSS